MVSGSLLLDTLIACNADDYHGLTCHPRSLSLLSAILMDVAIVGYCTDPPTLMAVTILQFMSENRRGRMFGYGNGYAVMKRSQDSFSKTSAKIEGFAGRVQNPDQKFHHDDDGSAASIAINILYKESDKSGCRSGDLTSRLSGPQAPDSYDDDINLEVPRSGRSEYNQAIRNDSAV